MGTNELFSRIVVAMSGTESSQAAAELAFRLARTHRAHVVLVNVVDTGMVDGIARVMRRPVEEVIAELEKTSRNVLRHGEVMARQAKVSAESVLRRGVAYQEIVSEAEDNGADLIVLGSTHVEGPRRLAIGRVVERVIEHTYLPVLVVRHRAARRSEM